MAEAAETLLAQFNALAGVYDDATIGNYCEQITKIVESLPALRRAPDEQLVMKLHATLRAYHNHLDRLLADKRAGLRAELSGIALPQLPTRRELDHLAQPIASDLFGRHLEAVRKGLQQVFGQYEQQCISLATSLEDLRAEAAGDVGAENLATLTRRERTLAGEIAKARTVGERIGEAYRAYSRALALFNAAQLFEHTLARLGEAGAECKQEFDALIHNVNAAFGTRRERALDEVASWESRLTALQQRAADLEQQQRERFEEWQEGYHKALNAHVDLSHTPAWRPQPFDPVHLEESRERVREAAQRAVKEALAEVVEACRVAQGTLASIFHSGDIESVPDETRGGVIGDAERCQALCGDVQRRMQTLIQQASERGSEIFAEPADTFDAYCASVGQAQREARSLLDLLRRVEGALDDARLTEPEQTLLDTIQALSVSGGRGVDLGLLLSSSGQTLATLLPLLGALYSKRKLYVTLESNAARAPQVAPTVEERPVIPTAGVSE